MSYLLDRKIRRRKIWTTVILVLLFAFAFYFRTGVWSGLSVVAGKGFHPVLILGNKIGDKFSNTGAYFSSKKSLEKEKQDIALRLGESEAKMLNYKTVISENEMLKEILGRKKEDSNLLLSGIISKPNQSAYDTMLIDSGLSHGLKAGDLVLGLGDIPIGRVAEAEERTSRVILFSSAGERTQAVIGGHIEQEAERQDIFYELVGRGGGNFEMILPREITVKKGDQVVMPGIYPYVLAVVESVISDPRDPFTKVLLVAPVNIQAIKFVQTQK